MGQKVTLKKLAFVSFQPKEGGFMAFVSMEGLILMERDPALVLREAAKVYEHSIIVAMRPLIAEIHSLRRNRIPTPARKMWRLGNAIFELVGQLEQLSLQLDGFYDHLTRDLGVKRKWLEKVIILRRYLPEEELIPESLNWGRCEKGTRKVAEGLRAGRLMDKAVSATS